MKYLRTLIRFTSGYFWPCVAFTTILYCVVPMSLGVTTRAFFDSFTTSAGINVWTVVALIVALQLSEVLAELAVSRGWSSFSYKAHTLLQRNMFAGILRGFGRHGLPVPPGDALSRFREDPPAITSGSMDGVCDLIARGIFAVIAAVVMWRIEPVLTITAFVPVVVGALVSDVLGTRSSRYGAAALESTTTLSRFLGEIINAQLAVRVAGAKGRVIDRLGRIGDDRRRLSLRDHVFAESLNSMNFHLVHVSTGAVLLIGASKIRDGTFTVGDFAMFVIFLDQLTYLPAEIGRVITELKRTRVSIRRMNALLPGEAPESVVAPAPVYLRRALPAVESPPERTRLERLEWSVSRPSIQAVDGVSRTFPSRSKEERSPSSPAESVAESPRCCTPFSASFPATREKSAGTGSASTIQQRSSYRPDVRSRHRCRACSARPCAKIFS